MDKKYYVKLCNASQTLCEFCEIHNDECEYCIVNRLISDAFNELSDEERQKDTVTLDFCIKRIFGGEIKNIGSIQSKVVLNNEL